MLQLLAKGYTLPRQRSQTAHFIEVAGPEHATDILLAHPELAEVVAAWLAHK